MEASDVHGERIGAVIDAGFGLIDEVDRILLADQRAIDRADRIAEQQPVGVGARAANKAAKSADTMAARIKASMGSASSSISLMSGAIGALGGAATLAAFTALASRSLDYASSLGEVSQQLRILTKDLQEYRFAATQVGISHEEMDKSLAKLTVTMGQAREGVAKPKAASRNCPTC